MINDLAYTHEDKAAFYAAFFNEQIYLAEEPEPVLKRTDDESAEVELAEIHKQVTLSGNKMAKTLLLFNYTTADIPREDKAFLNQILAAVQLSADAVSWFSIAAEPDVKWDEIAYVSHAENIITFDVPENFLPLKHEEGKLHIYDNRKMLCVDNLQNIASNINKKKLLWKGLQEMFSL